MAKNDKDKKTEKVVVARTLDERDVRTPADREQDAEERAEAAAKAYDESDPGEIVDRSRLPLNHPTLIGPDDTQPPPEATPREGKTSGQASATIPKPPPEAGPKGDERQERVLVEATQMGYYDLVRRRAGDIFSIVKKEFSERWMKKPAEGVSLTPVRLSNQVIAQHHDATLAARFGLGTTGNRGVTGGLDQAEEENPFKT